MNQHFKLECIVCHKPLIEQADQFKYHIAFEDCCSYGYVHYSHDKFYVSREFDNATFGWFEWIDGVPTKFEWEQCITHMSCTYVKERMIFK